MRIVLTWIVCLIALPACSLAGETRLWRSGKHEIRGEFVRSEDGQITIRRADNAEEVTVSLEILSEKDQQYVRQQAHVAPSDPSEAAPASKGKAGKQQVRDLAKWRSQLPQPTLYPSQTAIESVPWVGVQPTGFAQGTWRLRSGPDALQVDPQRGQAKWDKPVRGFHFVAASLSTAGAELRQEWWLRVVEKDIADVRIFSTRYLDYVVPAKYALAMEQIGLRPVIDAAWERLRDMYGISPTDGKQVVKYAPAMGGGAHSGNPVMMGPGWWNDDPVDCWSWMVHIPVHEFGHNFHGLTNIGPIISGQNPPLDRPFHHGMELTEVAIMTRIAQSPDDFGMAGISKASYLKFYKRQVENGLRRAEPFRKWIASQNKPEAFEGDTYGIGETICYELCGRYGPSVLEQTMRLFRHDALKKDVYDSADNEIKRQTLLWCMFSCAAGTDLRPYFRSWGFPVDDGYFSQMSPSIKKAIAELPPFDVAGWSQSPVNRRFYRVTPWPTTFWAAEATALGMKTHLAAPRNAEESEWLAQRFAGRGPLWIGLTDDGTEGIWRRLDGSRQAIDYWANGEPNGGDRENAAVLNHVGGPKWVDINQEDRNLGIFEISLSADVPRSKR